MSVYGYMFDFTVKNKIQNKFFDIQSKTSEILDEVFIQETERKQSKKDDLITKCKNSFNICSDVQKAKYGLHSKINKIERFDDLEKAKEFARIWGSEGIVDEKWIFGIVYYDPETEEFPIALIAISTDVPDRNMKLPSLLVCNKDGGLSEKSKKSMSCGG